MALVLPEGKGDPIREEFLLGPVDRLGSLVVIAPVCRAGDPGFDPWSRQEFFLLNYLYTTYQMVILKAKFSSELYFILRGM